jgi:transcriptional regulator with XRE-family HTH domain
VNDEMFKDKLKQLRLDKGVTQSDIAKAIGVSPATIGNYEQGTREPRRIETLEKIAEYFGVSVECLMDDNSINQYDMYNGIIYRSEKEIDNYIKTLTEDEMRLIIKRNMMSYVLCDYKTKYEPGTFGYFLEMNFDGIMFTTRGIELCDKNGEMIFYFEYGFKENFDDVIEIVEEYLNCRIIKIQSYVGLRVLDCGIGNVDKIILEVCQ